MKLVISDEDKLDSWETLINTVDKTDIPIQFVNYINLVFKVPNDHGDEQDINVRELREHGWQNHEIERIVQQTLNDNDDNIQTIHFYIDVKHVAEIVQRQTDRLLEGTK